MTSNPGLPTFTPGPEAIDNLEQAVTEWVFSEPLRGLVGLTGGKLPPSDTRSALSWLDDFSFREWDFRAGRERSSVVPHDYSPGDTAVIMAAVRALGLAGHTIPTRESYDRMLVLGGGAPACLARPAYASTLLADGLRVGRIAGLGSSRALTATEQSFLGGPLRNRGRRARQRISAGLRIAGIRGTGAGIHRRDAHPGRPAPL